MENFFFLRYLNQTHRLSIWYSFKQTISYSCLRNGGFEININQIL